MKTNASMFESYYCNIMWVNSESEMNPQILLGVWYSKQLISSRYYTFIKIVFYSSTFSLSDTPRRTCANPWILREVQTWFSLFLHPTSPDLRRFLPQHSQLYRMAVWPLSANSGAVISTVGHQSPLDYRAFVTITEFCWKQTEVT